MDLPTFVAFTAVVYAACAQFRVAKQRFHEGRADPYKDTKILSYLLAVLESVMFAGLLVAISVLASG